MTYLRDQTSIKIVKMLESARDVGRECSGCTACCTELRVQLSDDEWKPAHEPCRHLSGDGCGIYATRPKPCSGFECLWRHGVIRRSARPTKIGVMFRYDFTSFVSEKGLAMVGVVAHELRAGAIDHPSAKAVLAYFSKFMPIDVIAYTPPGRATLTVSASSSQHGTL